MTEASRRRVGVMLLAFIAALYVHYAMAFVLAERLNQDEGWYLIAARLVGEGQRPYADFAYVQPPLLPYVYGALGADESLMAGRKVSLLFGLLTVVFVGVAGWRGGMAAGLLAAVLVAFTPFVLSQQSIVKAYALANACQAGGLALAVWARGRRGWLAAAAAAFALAALARNSAAPALVGFLLWLAVDRERRRGLLPAAAAGVGVYLLGLLPFLIADAGAVRWNLLEHHAANAPRDPAVLLISVVVLFRIMAAACPALCIAALAGFGLVALRRREGEPPATLPEIELAFILALLVALGHFASGHPYQEYQVLAVPAVAVLAGLCWGALLDAAADRRMVVAWLVVLAGIFPILAIGPATAQLAGFQARPDGSRDPLGVHGPVQQVVELVQRYAEPDEEVFTFQTNVAIEAQRPLTPGLTLASFSFTDDPAAGEHHLVNPAIIAELFAEARPAVVVVSPGDLQNLFHGEWTAGERLVPQAHLDADALATYGPLVAALDRNYRLVGRVEKVGQFFEDFIVMARRDFLENQGPAR